MNKDVKTESNMALQVLALVLFFFGLVIAFIFPIGTILGLAIMLGCVRMGYKRRKVWLCNDCGYFFERG
jgi:hypothetical protein